jgi:hypothetical protein
MNTEMEFWDDSGKAIATAAFSVSVLPARYY